MGIISHEITMLHENIEARKRLELGTQREGEVEKEMGFSVPKRMSSLKTFQKTKGKSGSE